MAEASPASLVARTRWWGFAVFTVLAVVHVTAIALGADAIVYPTKLALMPVLALAAMWALAGTPVRPAATLLYLALAFSWLGDGASFFFPFLADELPAMLLCFGVAHLIYMWIFFRHVRVRAIPPWSVVYAIWWGAMIAVLWPHLGALSLAVAIYGLVLAGTATLATRGGTITAIGGAFFLASDTILALRLFLPGGLPETLAGPWVMITYTAGQALLVLGIVRFLRGERP